MIYESQTLQKCEAIYRITVPAPRPDIRVCVIK